MTPEQRIERLEGFIGEFVNSDRYISKKHFELLNGRNIQVGIGEGTMIGTSALQKLGFFGKSPVAQQANIGAPTAPGGAYSQAEAQSAVAAINSIRTALDNLGFTA